MDPANRCGGWYSSTAGEAVYGEARSWKLAEEFVASGNYGWNSGMFLWSARTLTGAIREHCPEMAPLLEKIAAAYGTPEFAQVFAEVYPQCEHQYRLCCAGAALGEGRRGVGDLLPACGFWVE